MDVYTCNSHTHIYIHYSTRLIYINYIICKSCFAYTLPAQIQTSLLFTLLGSLDQGKVPIPICFGHVGISWLCPSIITLQD